LASIKRLLVGVVLKAPSADLVAALSDVFHRLIRCNVPVYGQAVIKFRFGIYHNAYYFKASDQLVLFMDMGMDIVLDKWVSCWQLCVGYN